MIKTLFEAGESPNVAAKATNRTPFHEAVQSGHIQLADVFIGTIANINARTASGQTGGHIAANPEDSSILSHMLEAGVSMESRTSEMKQTPLYTAAMEGRLQGVKLLLEAFVDRETCCSKEYSALHYAVGHWHAGVVKALLSAGAMPLAKNINS